MWIVYASVLEMKDFGVSLSRVYLWCRYPLLSYIKIEHIICRMHPYILFTLQPQLVIYMQASYKFLLSPLHCCCCAGLKVND